MLKTGLMNLKAFLPCLLFFLFATQLPNAHAQFWPKWLEGKSKQRKTTHKQVNQPTKPKPITTPAKQKGYKLEYPSSVLKDRYRIDILAPLYLDELVKNGQKVYKDKVPEKAQAGIDFYQGVKLAADSLTQLGYKLDVYIHDVTQYALTPEMIIKNGTLDESDLIIGVLQYAQLKPIAAYAKKLNINFISALSPSDGDVVENPYFIMVQPTLETHCKKLTNYVTRKFLGERKLVLYRSSNSIDSIANAYLAVVGKNGFEPIECNNIPNKAFFEAEFDSTVANIILMPIVDANYADFILQKLNSWFPSHQFKVYGMPSWKALSAMRKPDLYPNISISFPSPFYFDPNAPLVQHIANVYRKEFNSRPSEIVYRGYESLFWYGALLQRYGTLFNLKQNDTQEALFTRYDMKDEWTKQQDFLYWQNEHVYLFNYAKGACVVEQ